MDYIPKGVLNSNQLRGLLGSNVIQSTDKLDAEGSAFNLHLGKRGWLLNGSIKQIAGLKQTVEAVCRKYGSAFTLKSGGMLLKKGTVTVIELVERVDFSQHPWLIGEATGKSSIGRLDILTRLLVDRCPEYERVPYRYRGPLYVEIAPISFDIRIYPSNSLNQLRIHCGFPTAMDSLVGRRLLFDSKNGRTFSSLAQEKSTLSLDISPADNKDLVAFVLRKRLHKELDFKLKGNIDPKSYFEPVRSKGGSITIEVNRFYILRSIERLALPKDIAVTGMAYSENLGELRIHYAGFAHPWFGMQRPDHRTGAPLIFEVRAHSFPIVLRHREVFATIRFYKMSEDIPDDDMKASEYSSQELKLSTFFKKRSNWP